MLELLKRNWWLLALRGVVSVGFGVLALMWPGATLAVLIALYGAYALVDGVFSIASAINQRGTNARTGLLWFEGIFDLIAGVVAWVWPGLTALVLVYVIACWAVITGVLEIASAIRLRKEMEGEWLLGAAGLASIAFGVVLAVRPLAGTLAMLWLLGWYAIIFGLFLVGLAISVRVRRPGAHPPHAAHA